ncbi:hypothetical protein [Ethanoligenens sp.]|uniref:hypothetical protein n=1 Tax=Ethanoligenens sp. TaxID=2099655 RepID=UPI0039E88B9A
MTEPNKIGTKKKRRLAVLLLAIFIPTTVFAAGVAFVPSFRDAVASVVASIFNTQNPKDKKPKTTLSARSKKIGSGPDSAAGFGDNTVPPSHATSAASDRTTYAPSTVVYGIAGSATGQWSATVNNNPTEYQQAVFYECTVNTSYQKQDDGTTKKVMIDTKTTRLGESQIIGPGQHFNKIVWDAPLTGQTRVICAEMHSYKLNGGQYIEVTPLFVQNLTLNIQ